VKASVTGLRAWLVQRVSAVLMLLFILFLLFHFLLDPPRSYQEWHGWMRDPGVSAATLVFFAALFLHTWVGVRDVVMDYVHPVGLRVSALALLVISLVAMTAWVGRIVLMRHG
jgi:succinate dehydrogenase / fumarate reductase, membrane anchor subunit